MEGFFAVDFDDNSNKISYVDLSHFNASLVTSTAGMFCNCYSIEEIKFTNFDTSKVNNMESMFYGCSQLSSLDLSNFITSRVTNMGRMFGECSNLTSLDLSNFDTRNNNIMAEMFNGCRSLTSLNLSNFDTSFTKDIDFMFCNCSSLEYLDISNFNFMFVGEINDMFSGINNKLKYIGINNIKYYQFVLDDLNSTINNQNNLMVCQKDNIITNEKVTYCCCDFSKSPLKCDCNNYINVKYINRVEYDNGYISFIINKDSLLLKDEPFIIEANSSIDIVISNPITKLDNFFNSDFDEYSGSISYVDLSHFNASLVTSTYQMFKQCYSIKEINFTNIQTPSIQTMLEMFSGCSQLISLDLSNFDTSSVTQMGELMLKI